MEIDAIEELLKEDRIKVLKRKIVLLESEVAEYKRRWREMTKAYENLRIANYLKAGNKPPKDLDLWEEK